MKILHKGLNIFCHIDQKDIYMYNDMRKRTQRVNGQKQIKAFSWVKPDDLEILTKIPKLKHRTSLM